MHNNHTNNCKLFIQCTQQKRSTVHGVTQEAKKACSLLFKTSPLLSNSARIFWNLPRVPIALKIKTSACLFGQNIVSLFWVANLKSYSLMLLRFWWTYLCWKQSSQMTLLVSRFQILTLIVKILSVNICLLLHLWCTDRVTFIYQTRKDCIGRNIENLLLKLKIAMFQRYCCLFLK